MFLKNNTVRCCGLKLRQKLSKPFHIHLYGVGDWNLRQHIQTTGLHGACLIRRICNFSTQGREILLQSTGIGFLNSIDVGGLRKFKLGFGFRQESGIGLDRLGGNC